MLERNVLCIRWLWRHGSLAQLFVRSPHVLTYNYDTTYSYTLQSLRTCTRTTRLCVPLPCPSFIVHHTTSSWWEVVQKFKSSRCEYNNTSTAVHTPDISTAAQLFARTHPASALHLSVVNHQRPDTPPPALSMTVVIPHCIHKAFKVSTQEWRVC